MNDFDIVWGALPASVIEREAFARIQAEMERLQKIRYAAELASGLEGTGGNAFSAAMKALRATLANGRRDRVK